MLRAHPLLFVARHQYKKDHHNTATFFPSAPHEFNTGAFTPGGALKTIDFARGGAVRTLLDVPAGAVRDPTHLADRAPFTPQELQQLEALTGVPLTKLASHDKNRGPQVSFERPELSPCLAAIQDLGARQEAIALIRTGAERLARQPDADQEGFEPCEIDRRREQKYAARQEEEARNRDAIRRDTRHYERPGTRP